jgi:hypothetical protein
MQQPCGRKRTFGRILLNGSAHRRSFLPEAADETSKTNLLPKYYFAFFLPCAQKAKGAEEKLD